MKSEDAKITIIQKDNEYFLICDLTPDPVYLCKVNELNSEFVQEQAEWTYQRIKRERIFAEWENSVIT